MKYLSSATYAPGILCASNPAPSNQTMQTYRLQTTRLIAVNQNAARSLSQIIQGDTKKCFSATSQHLQKKACSTQLLSAFSAFPLSVVRVLRIESGVRERFSFAFIVFLSPLHQLPPSACHPRGDEDFGGEESGEKVTPVEGSCQLGPASLPSTSVGSGMGSTIWTLPFLRGECGRRRVSC